MNTSISPTSIEILKTTAISKRGGARIGAGRKPKLKFEARELFNVAVDEKWPLIVSKMDEWIENGDKDMIKFIIEQRIGKPAQAVDIRKEETKVNYNLFYNPKIREATRIFEDQLKGELMKNLDTNRDEE
ncbi:MAG: hypothetical protein A2431_00520 [Candidatus Zambryskibacteria bacterium RIFOXYC1_FULL_39_10]|uniref:Uncharacterized protein n=1 Tax=Candidatus Zambryskibacteria bacterium RIFOXYC1_FULL_39_10 TaxID=1802779 RepID=A0A1G2UZ83_9BACT|nr:MAG: hypothetical protein A2431_00520 [Candidatus Zambryskibacteria bacterium RIFOXYC1_FULL_39_10]OHB15629.1 MAG: hypothetical protein A2605_02380 [Candidatus Zambryskibacteria bacterium RIFOXYD1_FULL_39_35]